jgi:hypothetical protein
MCHGKKQMATPSGLRYANARLFPRVAEGATLGWNLRTLSALDGVLEVNPQGVLLTDCFASGLPFP